jgi:hypothetical protein
MCRFDFFSSQCKLTSAYPADEEGPQPQRCAEFSWAQPPHMPLNLHIPFTEEGTIKTSREFYFSETTK